MPAIETRPESSEDSESCTPKKQKQKQASVEEELRRISAPWPDILTAHDPNFRSTEGQLINSRISPKFQARLDGYPGPFGWLQLQGIWEKELAEFPKATLVLQNIYVDVDETHGNATVHLDMNMSFTPSIRVKGFTELRWKRNNDGKWEIVAFHGIRGNAVNAGFV